MALFQRKPESGQSMPLYTLGLNKTVLLVGLGNIGKEYQGTRHNVGFAALDAFAENQDFSPWVEKRDLKCYQTSQTINGIRIIAIKPTTFMNKSGEAVQAAAHFYKINLSDIVVVHDELDLLFGQVRTRVGGSDAGNNGVKSIIQHIGEDFGRVRIGIKAKTPMDSADFVLAPFSKKEQTQLPALYKEVTAILTEYIFGAGQLDPQTRTFLI